MTPKRILFVLNKPNRALPVMNAICREIAALAPHAQRVSLLDPCKWRSLTYFSYPRLHRPIVRPIKNALRAAAARLQQ